MIAKGLCDLAAGTASAEALLVSIGAPLLRRAGLTIPPISVDNPEDSLYALPAASDSDAAHSRYNTLIRQLVSFEHALECIAG